MLLHCTSDGVVYRRNELFFIDLRQSDVGSHPYVVVVVESIADDEESFVFSYRRLALASFMLDIVMLQGFETYQVLSSALSQLV